MTAYLSCSPTTSAHHITCVFLYRYHPSFLIAEYSTVLYSRVQRPTHGPTRHFVDDFTGQMTQPTVS